MALDDACDARKREGDAQVWIAGLNDDADSMPRPMEGRWVAMALAPGNDTVHGSRLLLSALFERCVALGLRIGQGAGPDYHQEEFLPRPVPGDRPVRRRRPVGAGFVKSLDLALGVIESGTHGAGVRPRILSGRGRRLPGQGRVL